MTVPSDRKEIRDALEWAFGRSFGDGVARQTIERAQVSLAELERERDTLRGRLRYALAYREAVEGLPKGTLTDALDTGERIS